MHQTVFNKKPHLRSTSQQTPRPLLAQRFALHNDRKKPACLGLPKHCRRLDDRGLIVTLYVEELSLSKGIEGTAKTARASLPAFKRDCVGPLGFRGRTSQECARSDS